MTSSPLEVLHHAKTTTCYSYLQIKLEVQNFTHSEDIIESAKNDINHNHKG